MPRRRRTSKRPELGFEQLLELTCGPHGCAPAHRCRGGWHDVRCRASVFATEQSREGAYWGHRDEIVRHSPPGSRPWGWWRYESSDAKAPAHHRETLRLIELGLIMGEEAGQVIAKAAMPSARPEIAEAANLLRARLAAPPTNRGER